LPKRQVEDCLIIGTPRGPLRDFVDWWYWHRHDLLVRYSNSHLLLRDAAINESWHVPTLQENLHSPMALFAAI
jgi:hypothetical protein